MKLLHALPPVAALIAGGLWTGYQRQRTGALERESDLLRESIESARHADAAAASPLENSKGPHDAKGAMAGKKIDWKKVLEMQKSQNGDVGDMRLMIEMQKKLTSLSADELMAQLDEIAAMDLSEADRNQLQGTLIGVLAQKDPEKVLQRFADWIASDRMTWQLNDAFQKWAAKDVTAASAWMERQIAAGTFDSKSLDGRSGARMQFEGSLVASLLQSDPKSATERIKAFPEDQRSDVFNNLSYRLKPGTEKAAVEAMRATLPSGQYKESLDGLAQQVAQQGLDRAGDLVARIGASTEERTIIVSATFENQLSGRNRSQPVDAARIDEVRAWGLTQAPGIVNSSIGKALGNVRSYQGNFQANSQLAVKYAQESGNDDLMVAFLSGSGARENPSAALPLLDKISDPARREEVRKSLQPQDGSTY